ncbi:MAG: hypothetical protein LQ340_006668 [Diploschistes diacapsis]|nr:MAG: hypothetical protein LQ340_006668 [Diploschistes diacapsis]
MSSPKSNDASVIVVGGSLVGPAAAMFLSVHGVSEIVIERHAGSSPHLRAIGYTARTIGLLRSIGVESSIPLAPPGSKPRRIKAESIAGKWYDETGKGKAVQAVQVAPANEQRQAQGKLPSDPPPSAPAFSSCGNAAVPQDKMEPIFRTKALFRRRRPTPWLPNELLHAVPTGVTVAATDLAGTPFSVSGQYLIVADGAPSPIRESLGISPARHSATCATLCAPSSPPRPRWPTVSSGASCSSPIQQRDFEAFLVAYMHGRWALMSNADKATNEPDSAPRAQRRRTPRARIEKGPWATPCRTCS